MNENIDGSLVSLADEINALEADRKDGNQSKMVAMGHKMIAVRELLRARNGVHICGKASLDGHPPHGWGEWVKNNLRIGITQTTKCIRLAIDPEREAMLTRQNASLMRSRPKYYVSRIINMWPTMEDEQKQRIVNFCFERYNEERTQP